MIRARKEYRPVSFLAKNAFAGGLDYDWRLSQKYAVQGYWATSHIKGNTETITRLQDRLYSGGNVNMHWSWANYYSNGFGTTNVLRWEYKPGSALFVVFQQGKSDGREYGDFQFRRDFGGVFSAPSRNVFLVKFSYWLNM